MHAGPYVSFKMDADWIKITVDGLRHAGVAVIVDVLDGETLNRARESLYTVRQRISEEIGDERLKAAGELGVLRLPMAYDPWLLTFLELPAILEVVDRVISPTAILHLQNGFVLPSLPPAETPSVFQNRFHQDFPRVLNGYVMSVNCFITLTDFEEATGATLVVPGTHQKLERPDEAYLRRQALSAACPAGSMIVFDSTLWHAAGLNTSGSDRLSINHQFTRSYVKQQIDYPRALGDIGLNHPVERTRQLLGYWTRPPASLDQFYVPAERRLYRAGQG